MKSSSELFKWKHYELMKDIHDRMPVILRTEDEKNWLDMDQKPEYLKELLRNVKNQGPELVEEVK